MDKRVETYRAVIREPRAFDYEPDDYGTVTIPGAMTTYAPSPVPLRVWARKKLKECSDQAYCEIYRIVETLVERIYKDSTRQL